MCSVTGNARQASPEYIHENQSSSEVKRQIDFWCKKLDAAARTQAESRCNLRLNWDHIGITTKYPAELAKQVAKRKWQEIA